MPLKMMLCNKLTLWWLVICAGACACDRFIPPRISVLANEPCVVTMYYSDRLGFKTTLHSSVACNQSFLRPAWDTNRVLDKVTLYDNSGHLLCAEGGKAFSERYLNAPSKSPSDYALIISREGVKWVSEQEFYKIKKDLNDSDGL